MKKIAIMTDSNSGITQEKGKELGVCVLPMPFFINEKLYFEDITLTQEEFYKYLEEDADISTSQPSPGDVMERWDQLLEEYDEVVHIPMSSGLSGSCETAMTLAQDYDGKVQVVNNQRISVTQEQSVYDAILLRDAGKDAAQIKEILEAEKFESTIYITVDTLKYLKKGGRITPAAADSGRKAGCICKSTRMESGKADDAQGDRDRSERTFQRKRRSAYAGRCVHMRQGRRGGMERRDPYDVSTV